MSDRQVLPARLLRCLLTAALICALQGTVLAADSWKGVDEAVVEKIAREHGREAKAPLLNPESGDLMLFAFLVAGACGGFAAGYYWRDLLQKKRE